MGRHRSRSRHRTNPPGARRTRHRSGMVLGSTKTSGAEGSASPRAGVGPLIFLCDAMNISSNDMRWAPTGGSTPTRARSCRWCSPQPTVGLANRQSVTKEIGRAAKIAGIDPKGLASHSGRRTVVTALYADGGLDLADVARHVGHADPSTTAEYVRSLGSRPSDTAARAARAARPHHLRFLVGGHGVSLRDDG